MATLAEKLAEYRQVLASMGKEPIIEPAPDAVTPLTAESIADAVASALAKFADDKGRLRVADNAGVRPA